MTWTRTAPGSEVVQVGPDHATAWLSVQPVPLASGPSEWANLLAMVMGFTFLMAVTIIVLLNRWKRPDLDGEHAAYILTQLNSFGGTGGSSVVVRSADALDDADVLEDIRGLFHGEKSSEPKTVSASRRAWTEIMTEVRAELHERAPPVSKVPVRAVQEAILTALFGAVAVVPVAVW